MTWTPSQSTGSSNTSRTSTRITNVGSLKILRWVVKSCTLHTEQDNVTMLGFYFSFLFGAFTWRHQIQLVNTTLLEFKLISQLLIPEESAHSNIPLHLALFNVPLYSLTLSACWCRAGSTQWVYLVSGISFCLSHGPENSRRTFSISSPHLFQTTSVLAGYKSAQSLFSSPL